MSALSNTVCLTNSITKTVSTKPDDITRAIRREYIKVQWDASKRLSSDTFKVKNTLRGPHTSETTADLTKTHYLSYEGWRDNLKQ